MKVLKIVSFAIISSLIVSCSSSKNVVHFTGKIKGNVSELTLTSKKDKVNKVIKVNSKGEFSDTLNLKKPTYLALSNGKDRSVVYLKNGDYIKVVLDNDLKDAFFTGKGFEESHYMSLKAKKQEEFYGDSLFYKNKGQFNDKLNQYTQFLRIELAKAKDSLFKDKQAKYIKSFEKKAKSDYKFKSYLIKHLGKGTPAPDFSYPYLDKEDKEYMLKDLKGKYLYVKLWATWCGYCRKEAPYFKKLAKEYEGKNILFVGISTDKERSKKLWKNMVKKHHLELDLFGKNDKEFKKTYKINELPRFLLIDPEGNIIDADAPSPSDEKKIKGILNNLLK